MVGFGSAAAAAMKSSLDGKKAKRAWTGPSILSPWLFLATTIGGNHT
jgi:hypothetical protein